MSFWTGKRVVVTGGAGFVGVQLVRLLAEEGASVVVLDDFSRGRNTAPGSSLHWADGDLRKTSVLQRSVFGAYYHRGNATSLADCQRIMDGADAVFNLAAHVAGVIYNQSNHLEMYERNMALLTVPVQAAQECGVERFLQVSSVCVYAPDYNHPAIEEAGHWGEPVGANSGYSWAKRMGERVAGWSTIPRVVTVRPSNIYGPGDYFDEKAHVIPALIKKCLEDDEIVVNGTGQEEREFLFVKDAAAGMMAALEHGHNRQAYNIGTNGETCISIARLVSILQLATQTVDKPVRFTQAHDAGDPARWSDCEQAYRHLGWEYKTHIVDGLLETVEQYRGTMEQAA